jgi:hypothetical protein
VSILEALPDQDPLTQPLIVYILAAFEGVDRTLLFKAVDHVKRKGVATMVSLAAREWLAEGKAEGKAEGLREGRARTLMRQLSRRFGPIPEPLRARVEVAEADTLDLWLDRVLDAATAEAVLDGERPA